MRLDVPRGDCLAQVGRNAAVGPGLVVQTVRGQLLDCVESLVGVDGQIRDLGPLCRIQVAVEPDVVTLVSGSTADQLCRHPQRACDECLRFVNRFGIGRHRPRGFRSRTESGGNL